MQPAVLSQVFSENLRHYRTIAGLTQTELAQALGTSQAFISDLERGRKNPTLRAVAEFSEALGIPPHALVAPRAEKLAALS